MEKNAIFWIFVLTAVMSLLFSGAIVFSYSGNSFIWSLADPLILISRLWQVAGIPILIYFLIKKLPLKFLVVPIALIFFLFLPIIEFRILGISLGADLRNSLMIIIGLALAFYSSILLLKK